MKLIRIPTFKGYMIDNKNSSPYPAFIKYSEEFFQTIHYKKYYI